MFARILLSAALIVATAAPVPARGPAAAADAAPSLWEAPPPAASRDLFNGPWGAAYAPDPHDIYTFVRRKTDGVNPGVVVRDSRGRTWHVKQAPHGGDRGDEGPVEVVVSRVLSAIGYHQPPVYYLSSFMMTEGSRPHRENGGRFRPDDNAIQSRGTWSWRDNPFEGTRPFKGLLVALLVFNSWDLKDSNNRIYEVRNGKRVETWYVVRDLGGALGESGSLSPKRNNLGRFERQRYIEGVSSRGFVEFGYHGKRADLIDKQITSEDLRWASTLLAELDDRQWRDAFRAGGYPDVISKRFIEKIRANVSQGLTLTSPAWRSAAGGR
jgi:hypothetical protein